MRRVVTLIVAGLTLSLASPTLRAADGEKKPADQEEKKPAAGDEKEAGGEKKPAEGEKKEAGEEKKKPADAEQKAGSGEEKKAADGGVARVTLEEFEEKRKGEDVVVLDVRTPEEFEAGHVPGAANLNYRDEKFLEKLAALDKGKTYLVYCATGRRSTGATAKMKEVGFGKLFNFVGSMAAWNKADKPVEKGPGEKAGQEEGDAEEPSEKKPE